MGKVHPRNPKTSILLKKWWFHEINLIFSFKSFFHYFFLKNKTQKHICFKFRTNAVIIEIYMLFSNRKFQTHNPSSETTINLIPAAVWLLIDLKGENSPEEVPPIICPQQVRTKSLLFLSFKINKWYFFKTM